MSFNIISSFTSILDSRTNPKMLYGKLMIRVGCPYKMIVINMCFIRQCLQILIWYTSNGRPNENRPGMAGRPRRKMLAHLALPLRLPVESNHMMSYGHTKYR